ncbi:MAG: hybrid sensor histidine kinase/response regulator [Betaproteobacteria bacterium]|nr:MAG: hybrid sensor histidine kinase/response regulator [Betaproteobacteria bacterium]
MNIDDLVALLRDEYGLGLPDALQGLAEAGARPADASPLDAVEEFLDRSGEAAELVGMAGFARLVTVVRNVLSVQNASSYAQRLQWSASTLRLAERYLEAPGDDACVDAILQHFDHSLVSLDAPARADLSQMLRQRPSLTEASQLESNVAPVVDADLVLKRDDADEALLDVMLADAPRQLDQIYANLTAFAAQSANDTALAESQRIAHTLKGSASIIGLPAVARVSHRLEDLLDWFVELQTEQDEPPRHAVTDALSAVDLLQQMVGCLNGGEDEPTNVRDVLERLTQWAQAIADGDAMSFVPAMSAHGAAASEAMDSVTADDFSATPVISAPRVQPSQAATSATSVAPTASTEEVYLRVGSTHLNRVLRRATQSIIAAQRFTQQLRAIEAQLLLAQNRQVLLSSRLRELQATVDRQVVDLNDRRESSGQFDPLELDRYDSLHILSRFVAEAVRDQSEMAKEALALSSTAISGMRDEQRALREQHRDLLSTRLVAVKTIESRLRRNVAQTAREMGKQVRLVVTGENITVDSDVLSRLTEPLLHMLRNAVDHGIEPTELRTFSDKPAEGTITLDFKLEEQYVRVECSDDGGGLDLAAIRERAVRFGVVAPDAQLSEFELKQLILQRGFSTKDEVTEISGRGVGMDIVNDRVNAMKGTLSIDSTTGRGTTFSLRVPISGGIVLALMVQSGGQRVAISSEQVISALAPSQIDAKTRTVSWGDVVYPLQSLAAWLGFADATAIDTAAAGVLVRASDGVVVALAVDAVLEVRELVVQDVGPLIRRISGLSVASLDEMGRVVFLLDVAALERRARSSVSLSASLALRTRLAATRRRLLVVDDAISARRALQQVLEDRGYEVIGASDGADAIEALRRSTISLVLTDLEMPNVNGLELSRRMRDVPQWASIPVVMVTSRNGEKYRAQALEAGVNEFRMKPFAETDVLETVKRLLAEALPND